MFEFLGGGSGVRFGCGCATLCACGLVWRLCLVICIGVGLVCLSLGFGWLFEFCVSRWVMAGWFGWLLLVVFVLCLI